MFKKEDNKDREVRGGAVSSTRKAPLNSHRTQESAFLFQGAECMPLDT